MRTYTDYLKDIVENAERALRFAKGVSKRELRANEEKLFAVIRALEIIGEATKQVPPWVRRRYPQIPWRQMAGMRDVLIHGYFGVDFEVVWKTLRQDVPRVREAVAKILGELEEGKG